MWPSVVHARHSRQGVPGTLYRPKKKVITQNYTTFGSVYNVLSDYTLYMPQHARTLFSMLCDRLVQVVGSEAGAVLSAEQMEKMQEYVEQDFLVWWLMRV
uniref:Uncharacterized protein n=1 Tax=Eutreptiella gymnastica TaxID=73025 RepID=A0A7S4G766_9EUGL